MSAAADIELVQRLARGDRAALGTLYDRYAPGLIALAQRIVPTAGDAEEVVQEGLLEAWHRARYFDASSGSLHSWLALRVRARALQRVRAQRAYDSARVSGQVEIERGAAAPAGTPCGVLEPLTDEQRAVVELAYFGGWSCAEIATRLAVPVDSVKSRLASALALLQRQLEQSKGGQP